MIEVQATVRAAAPARRVPGWWQAIKRAGDLLVGGLLFVLTLPVVAAASAAIFVVTGGAPFFAQERVGQNGRHFKMIKLRTMIVGAHALRGDLMHLNEADGPTFKIRNDPRLHPLGAFLRRTSVDELPNLINVLTGDISLVGPRPALPSEVARYDEWAKRRLTVPQGITCLWQVGGRCSVTFEEWMALDNRYVDEWSPLGDLAILLKTIPAVIRRDGAH